jgi:Holliday junction resolvase-like predicted endonuclease
MIRYHKGRRFEYQVKKWLEEKGYIVLRTAGSHGFADLIAVGKNGEVIFYQLSYRFERAKYENLMDIAFERKIRIFYVVKATRGWDMYEINCSNEQGIVQGQPTRVRPKEMGQ